MNRLKTLVNKNPVILLQGLQFLASLAFPPTENEIGAFILAFSRKFTMKNTSIIILIS